MIKKLKLLVLLVICCDCATAMASEQTFKQKNKKLELKMSAPLPNGTFVHMCFNPLECRFSFVTFDPKGRLIRSAKPHPVLQCGEQGINESTVLKGFAEVEGGLLAVFIQPVNKQLSDARFFKGTAAFEGMLWQSLAGKIKDIKIFEAPDKSLIVKYLLKTGDKRIVKAITRISKSFDDITDPLVVRSYTKQ